MGTNNSDFYLPVYVINLKELHGTAAAYRGTVSREGRVCSPLDRGNEHSIGAVGLWQSMLKAVQTAIDKRDDIMIICEDDHIFTPAYNKDYLFANIIGANAQGSELLSGGVGGFGTAVPVDTNRYWMVGFGLRNYLILSQLFQKTLRHMTSKITDTADGVLSVLAKDKMTIYPFISVQKDFGYSDVTVYNGTPGMISNYFSQANYRLRMIHHVSHKFKEQAKR